jgi:hypothetical protein
MNEYENPVLKIQNLATEKLEVFKTLIRPDGRYKSRIYQGLHNASQQIESDYGGRFLIELIQNGYDAHPREVTDGKIKILIDLKEDTYGVLYVANGGKGFSWSNVEALCDIGNSDKPIGESIGNKGLGFRSVSYVTDDPQIYSKAGDNVGDNFNGYCFRFSHGEDFNNLLEDPVHINLAKKDIPRFHIPIALTDYPDGVCQFAKEGYSTVIRLPLRSEFAQKAVLEEIEALHNSEAPLILFLQRISILEVVAQEKPDLNFSLTRSSQPLNIDATTSSHKFNRVNLGQQGIYLVAQYSVPEIQVIKAIDLSIQQHQLHTSWKDWKGDGELAVAIRLDDGPVSPNLYTFLPMGNQAECPFYGYLHGSFYPKADRTSLIAAIPLNSLYIDETVNLCVRTILALRNYKISDDNILSHSEREKVVIDLLTWKQVSSIARSGVPVAPILIGEVFKSFGTKFAETDIFPVIQRNGNYWSNASEIWRWDHPDLTIFSAQQLIKLANVAILSSQLGDKRLARLQEFIQECDDSLTLDPSDLQLAEATEKIASTVFRRKVSNKSIRNFYLEMEQIFRDRPASLSGRRILFCADGILRPTMTKESDILDTSQQKRVYKRSKSKIIAIFSPSKRLANESRNLQDTSQILHVPKELTKRFAFLTGRLDWYDDLEIVRDFLEKNKLVRSFDAIELITQVSSVAQRNRNKKTLSAALSWVYSLWKSSQKSPRPISLGSTKLFVPTLNGEWIEPNHAIFSSGWMHDSLGDITEKFLSQAGIYSEDLRKLNNFLLARKEDKPFLSRNTEEWFQFLVEIGVNKGLQSSTLSSLDSKPDGRSFQSRDVCDRFHLGDSSTKYWKTDIDMKGGKAPYRSSEYEFGTTLSYFPGQEQFNSFSDDAKIQFAQLILSWLNTAEKDEMEVPIFSPSAKWASRFTWPTPLAAFIHQAPWVPVEIPNGLNFDLQFVKPSEVWFPGDGGDSQIPYLPRIHRSLRNFIFSEAIRNKFIEWCGANPYNSPSSLPKQVGFLGKIFAESRVEQYHLQSFLNLYYETWSHLAEDNPTDGDIISRYLQHLIVRQNGQYEAVTTDKEIYVRDTEDSLGLELLENSGFYIFDPGQRNIVDISKLLKTILGEQFKAVSSVKFTILLDGVDYDISESIDEFAVNICPWLPHVVYLAMESLTGTAAHRLPSDHMEIIHRLNNIRIHITKLIQFQINGTVIGLPYSSYGAIAFRKPNKPLLIMQSDSGDLSWESLAMASVQLSQLLEQSDLGSAMLIAFRALQRCDLSISGPVPTFDEWADEICRELHIDKGHMQKALEGLGRDIRRLVIQLRPIIHYFGGDNALQQFNSTLQKSETLIDVVNILKVNLVNTKHTAEEVVNICQRSTGFGFIRDELSLDFGRFNRSLIAVGEKPDLHVNTHKDAVSSFISLNKNVIMDCLRIPFIEQFKSKQSLQKYLQYRSEVDSIQPKSEWLVEYDVPDELMIKSLINGWLSNYNLPTIDNEQRALLPVWSEVRNDNKLRIKRLVQTYINTVKAWYYKHGVEPSEDWKASSAADNLCNTLEARGAIDFDVLDEANILSWLALANVWPKEMPQTIKLEELGLKQTDLNEQRNREFEAKLRREKDARSIVFNNRQIDPHEVDPADLASEISTTLPEKILKMKLDQLSILTPATQPSNKKPILGGHGKGGGNRSTHPDKTDLIGFLGEVAVFYWLKRQLLDQAVEDAWVSTYRERLFPGSGDNSCGYDFKIQHRKTIYLEVKSSLTDPQEFELGDTEVRKARDCAIKRGGEYRIVYVSNLYDTKFTRFEILPNPLSDEGKNYFRTGGNGIKYQFFRK